MATRVSPGWRRVSRGPVVKRVCCKEVVAENQRPDIWSAIISAIIAFAFAVGCPSFGMINDGSLRDLSARL